MSLQLGDVVESGKWNDLLTSLPDPHLLQCWQWGQLKSEFGWDTERLAWQGEDAQAASATMGSAKGRSAVAAAQLLTRRAGPASIGVTLAYCPRGPVLDWSDAELRRNVLQELIEHSRARGAFLLRIDPEVRLGSGEPEAGTEDPLGVALIDELSKAGWRRSQDQVQFDNTLLVDLKPDEETLLAGMKQKTRYNVRLALKHGVHVRRGGLKDLDLLYRMYAETSLRDGFVIRDAAYYRLAWGHFIEAELAQPFIAEVAGEPVAGLVAYRFGDRAWYLYGMSRTLHREKMPNYLLQWEAMRWAKELGCRWYDFVGAPNQLDPSDPLWGLYRFKQGFGSRFVRSIGAWDYPLRPLQYWVYHRVLPPVLSVMRFRGQRRLTAAFES